MCVASVPISPGDNSRGYLHKQLQNPSIVISLFRLPGTPLPLMMEQQLCLAVDTQTIEMAIIFNWLRVYHIRRSSWRRWLIWNKWYKESQFLTKTCKIWQFLGSAASFRIFSPSKSSPCGSGQGSRGCLAEAGKVSGQVVTKVEDFPS